MKKILIAVTSHSKFGETGRNTGLWLEEFTHFYKEFPPSEFQIDVASPRGGKIPLDPKSLRPKMMNSKMKILENTFPSSQLPDNNYDAIYYAGGHGAMWDLSENKNFQEISRRIYERGGVVSAICHGVAGLLNIRLGDGNYLINNKNLTGYSDREEWFGGTKKIIPYSLETELCKRGGNYSRSFIPFIPNIKIDGKLFTGQNPFSTEKLARAIKEELTYQ